MDSVKKGTIKVPWFARKKTESAWESVGNVGILNVASTEYTCFTLYKRSAWHSQSVSTGRPEATRWDSKDVFPPSTKEVAFISLLKGGNTSLDVIWTERKMEVTSLSWPMGAMSIHGLDRSHDWDLEAVMTGLTSVVCFMQGLSVGVYLQKDLMYIYYY